MEKKQSVSIIVPCKNEEESIKELYLEIKEVFSDLVKDKKISSFEVVFVNDGSTDKTQEVLEGIRKMGEKNLRIIEFRKNFGKSEAYKAGFGACTGDLIFTMDGDLQDNPADAPKFIEKIKEGYDLIVGWKYKRQDSFTKKFPSRIFNGILRSFSKLDLHDFDCGYRCMTREVLGNITFYGGLYRHIPLFAASKGFRITEVEVNHRKRKFGESKYGFSRFFGGFFDLITITFLYFYIKRPLHFFGGIGSLFFILGFSFALYLTYVKIFLGELIGNRPLLILSVLLIILGIQLILFGLLGEMIAHSNKEEKNYSIRKLI